MKYRLYEKTLEVDSAFSVGSDSIDLGGMGGDSFSVQVVADVDTPSAKTFDSGESEVTTLTFLAQANTDPGDYIVLYDTAGLAWAGAADITGSDPEPTGAIWTAIPAGRKVQVDLSAATTAATVAAAFEAALDALTGFPFATDDTANDGTMLVTCTLRGPTEDATPYDEDDSGPGTIVAVETNAGVASEVTVGTSQVSTLTFATKANTGDGDYVVIYDTAGLGWAVAADKTGTSPEPTGHVWANIPAARKGQADISAATTAAQVAAVFETAFDALVSVPFATDDSAANGTMLITVTLLGSTEDPAVYDSTDSGDGSIAAVVTTEGAFTDFTIPSHGLPEGLKGQLTTTGTLPTGLSLATDYFIIPVDSNTVRFASTLANATASVPIPVNVTTQGVDGSVNTFTPTSLAGGTIKLQQSNDNSNWSDLGSATNITVDATIYLEKDRPTSRYVRTYLTLTAGHISTEQHVLIKGDKDC